MSGYRPITASWFLDDLWFLTRAKLRHGATYYGAYLGGFPERARVLLGATIDEPVLHVCGGCARLYPYPGGFGRRDKTLDLDPATRPDYHQDAREPLPRGFKAYLCDPPYSELDATHYVPGAHAYPPPGLIVRNAIDALDIGGRVGIIHYLPPAPPPNARYVAQVSIYSGFNNRVRSYAVYEKTRRGKR